MRYGLPIDDVKLRLVPYHVPFQTFYIVLSISVLKLFYCPFSAQIAHFLQRILIIFEVLFILSPLIEILLADTHMNKGMH